MRVTGSSGDLPVSSVEFDEDSVCAVVGSQRLEGNWCLHRWVW